MMTDKNEQKVVAQVKADAADKRQELLAKRESRGGGQQRQEALAAQRAMNAQLAAQTSVTQPTAAPQQVETLPDVVQRSNRTRKAGKLGGQEIARQNVRRELGFGDTDEATRQAGVDALRQLAGLPVEAAQPDAAEESDGAPEAGLDAAEALVAALRGEGPQPMPNEHKEALRALQMPEAMIAAWAEKDPDGLAKFAEGQYELRRKRDDAFSNRDRTISTLTDRLRAIEQELGLSTAPTPPQGGAEPEGVGDALRAALGEDASRAPAGSDLQSLIQAEVRKLAAPLLEQQAQVERQRLQSAVHTSRRELAASFPGLLDDATFTQRVAPVFTELYQAGVAGRNVRSLMELAAFRGLGGATRMSEVIDPTPSRNEPGTRQGGAMQQTALTPQEAGRKALNEFLRLGDKGKATAYAKDLAAQIRR